MFGVGSLNTTFYADRAQDRSIIIGGHILFEDSGAHLYDDSGVHLYTD